MCGVGGVCNVALPLLHTGTGDAFDQLGYSDDLRLQCGVRYSDSEDGYRGTDGDGYPGYMRYESDCGDDGDLSGRYVHHRVYLEHSRGCDVLPDHVRGGGEIGL